MTFLLKAVAGDGRVDLDWPSDIPKATKFRVKRASPPGSGPVTLTNPAITNSEFTDKTCTNGLVYGYFVIALDRRGDKVDESTYVIAMPRKPSATDLPTLLGHGSGVTGGGSAIPQQVTTAAQFMEAVQDTGPRVIYGNGDWLLGNGEALKANGDLTIVDVSIGKMAVVYRGDNTRLHNYRSLPNGASADADGLTVNGQSTAGPVNGFAASNSWFCGGPDMGGAAILGEVFDLTLQQCVFGPGLVQSLGSDERNHNRILNYTTFGEHADGPWGKRQTTFECLVFGGEERNPDIKYVEGVDFVRNLIYNFRESPNGNPRGLNYMYNRVRTGPESGDNSKVWKGAAKPDEAPYPDSVFSIGNVADGFVLVETFLAGTHRTTPFGTPSVTATQAPTVEEILAIAGPTTGRNTQEQTLIDHVRNRTSDGYYYGPGAGTPNLTWPTNP